MTTTFNNLNEFNQASDKLELQLVGSANQFADYVAQSVLFFYGAGDKNTGILNRVLVIAHRTKGFNADKLRKYIAAIVPCTTSKGKDGHAPTIGKKDKKQEWPAVEAVNIFVLTQWHQWSEPEGATKSAYEWQKSASNLGKKLYKELGAEIPANADLIQAIVEGYNLARESELSKKTNSPTSAAA